MLERFTILKTIILFIIPYLVLYAVYIQLGGETSPGGGFQAGVIFATGLIAFDLIYGEKQIQKLISQRALIICAVLGVLIYCAVGMVSFWYNDNYLNYYSLAKNTLIKNPLTGQHIGIFLVEIGVGLTVASVMCLIYLILREE